MLKIKIGRNVLFSHWLSTTLEYPLSELMEIAQEQGITNVEDLQEFLEKQMESDFREDCSNLNGDVGNGEYYPYNEDHDWVRVDMEFSDEILEGLKQYFAEKSKKVDFPPGGELTCV